MDSSSSGGPSTSSPEADMAGPSVAQSNSGASDQTLTTGQRKLSWWERFLQRIYSKEEFEAYLLNKDRRKKKDKEKNKRSAVSTASTDQTTADSVHWKGTAT